MTTKQYQPHILPPDREIIFQEIEWGNIKREADFHNAIMLARERQLIFQQENTTITTKQVCEKHSET